jgi:UDP-4-amino-4,6-dideoxy-N-acetyl-beta-L-altrosamine N-acetyltransferase
MTDRQLTELASKLELWNIVDLPLADQLRVLELRNQDSIRNNMYTNHLIAEDEHLAWIERLTAGDHTRFFVVFAAGQIVGGVSLLAISHANRRTDWLFYIGEHAQGRGYGSALEFKFLDYVFFDNDFEKLNCEVLEFNRPVIALHRKFGFVEEGFRRDHILRDGRRYGAYLLGITRQEWIARRAEFTRTTDRQADSPEGGTRACKPSRDMQKFTDTNG